MSTRHDTLDFAVPLLAAVGFQKRSGNIFTLEMTAGVLGWLGLNRATRHRGQSEVEINPVVGVRHQELERIVAELRGEKFHPYRPPTICMPLGYLMPEARYRAWVLSAANAHELGHQLVTAVEQYALPAMRAKKDLPEILGALEARWGADHLLAYRLPVVWLLRGEVEKATSVMGDLQRQLGGRTDAAAQELRRFAGTFGEWIKTRVEQA